MSSFERRVMADDGWDFGLDADGCGGGFFFCNDDGRRHDSRQRKKNWPSRESAVGNGRLCMIIHEGESQQKRKARMEDVRSIHVKVNSEGSLVIGWVHLDSGVWSWACMYQ